MRFPLVSVSAVVSLSRYMCVCDCVSVVVCVGVTVSVAAAVSIHGVSWCRVGIIGATAPASLSVSISDSIIVHVAICVVVHGANRSAVCADMHRRSSIRYK